MKTLGNDDYRINACPMCRIYRVVFIHFVRRMYAYKVNLVQMASPSEWIVCGMYVVL